jgi:hypothetical protein
MDEYPKMAMGTLEKTRLHCVNTYLAQKGGA